MTRPANIDVPSPRFDGPPNLIKGIRAEEHIRGNAPDRVKSQSAAAFRYFVDASGASYGADTGRKLKYTEINVSDLTEVRGTKWTGSLDKLRDGLTVETVFEVVVDQGMHCHGLYSYLFPDPCSFYHRSSPI
jgi:hypothetical protein